MDETRWAGTNLAGEMDGRKQCRIREHRNEGERLRCTAPECEVRHDTQHWRD
jgi:hypothetical protein